jgi:peptidoglycan LD-endopeptidase LytH
VKGEGVAALKRRLRRPSLRQLLALAACLPVALLPLGCDPAGSESLLEPYFPRNAHAAYGHALAQSRLAQAALGQDWIAAAERALDEPANVPLPFSAVETLDAARPAALGYRFPAPSGQRLTITIDVSSEQPLEAFVDLFEMGPDRLVHVASSPPAPRRGEAASRYRIEWAALDDADLVLRVQPELLRGGDFAVEIAAAPYLSFPVDGLGMRAIQSGFGADRDAGRRAHRGVDIFAARGTNALAALDAWVTRVETTPRGGNVVWMQPLFGEMRLYYAHLDTQLVVPGQFVAVGDVVGTVGNTGNAVTTPPHLHFGVYLSGRGQRRGAQDPVGFLK